MRVVSFFLTNEVFFIWNVDFKKNLSNVFFTKIQERLFFSEFLSFEHKCE